MYPYVIERNENITTERARGDAWTVRDEDGQKVGTISHGERGWTVFSAGWGVTVDHNEVHPFKDAALAAVAEARKTASLPDGALAFEHGLTGFQRASIDMMRKYAMSDVAKLPRIIWDQFDMSPTQFYSEWNALLDNPNAAAYDALIINRHRRIRDQRKADRTRTPVSA